MEQIFNSPPHWVLINIKTSVGVLKLTNGRKSYLSKVLQGTIHLGTFPVACSTIVDKGKTVFISERIF